MKKYNLSLAIDCAKLLILLRPVAEATQTAPMLDAVNGRLQRLVARAVKHRCEAAQRSIGDHVDKLLRQVTDFVDGTKLVASALDASIPVSAVWPTKQATSPETSETMHEASFRRWLSAAHQIEELGDQPRRPFALPDDPRSLLDIQCEFTAMVLLDSWAVMLSWLEVPPANYSATSQALRQRFPMHGMSNMIGVTAEELRGRLASTPEELLIETQ